MADNAFENLERIYLSDTFRAWFDKTNQIITTINPIEIYGVTADSGEVAGITIDIDSNGIAYIGLSLPTALTGSFRFTSGVTFENEVRVSGLTLDLAPSGGQGATLYGRVVRSINGATGDIVLTTVTIPGSPVDGDILYYETSGSTFNTYNLFSGGTATDDTFNIGSTGGVFVGVTQTGASAANFIEYGNIQLVGRGTTGAGIYLVDADKASLSTIKTAGADIRYSKASGSNLLTFTGRNISGVTYSTSNLTIDFDTQRSSFGGVTGAGVLNIHDTASGKYLQFIDGSGYTMNFRQIAAGSLGGRTSGGYTGLAEFGGNPASKGLKQESRVRLENTNHSVEIEITGTGKTSGFIVYGVNETGPYGSLLTPTLHARRDGDVVIGGIAPDDGGITGTTHGSLNIASGKLYVGGSIGSLNPSGLQVLSSNGSTAGWKTISNTAINYTGSFSSLLEASKSPASGSLIYTDNKDSTIEFLTRNGDPQTGPFAITVSFPLMKLFGSYDFAVDAVIGVLIDVDGSVSEMEGSILWKDVAGVDSLSPTFFASGIANNYIRIIPFATQRLSDGYVNIEKEGFAFVTRGVYKTSFDKIG